MKLGGKTRRYGNVYDAITAGLISHDGSPQMLRHFKNARLHEDARGARLRKQSRHSVNKIDIAVAPMIAHHRACAWREEDAYEPQILVL